MYDNDWYRWVILFAAFFTNFLSWGVLYAVGVLFYNWVEYFDESRGLVAIATALPTGLGCVGGPFFGFLIEKYGTRVIGTIGGIIMAGSHIASAYAGNVYYLCIVYGVFAGVGAGLANLSAAYSVNNYFKAQRTLAEGIATTGVSAGTFFFGFFQEYLIRRYGWRSSIMVIGAICMNLVVFAMLSYTPSYRKKLFPFTEEKSKSDFDDLVEYNTKMNAEKEKREQASFSERSSILWKKRAFIVILVADTIAWLVAFIPYVHLAERARLLGIHTDTAAWIVSTIGLAGIVGRPLVSIIAGLANILSPIFSTKLGLFIFAMMFGIAGSDYALVKASVSKVLGNEWFGVAFSWMLLFQGAGIVLGPPIAGWIYDVTESYNAPFYVSGAAYLLSAAIVLVYTFNAKKLPQSTSQQALLKNTPEV